jgi:hypothetical protein
MRDVLVGAGSDRVHLGLERIGRCCRAADRLVRLAEGVQQRQHGVLALRFGQTRQRDLQPAQPFVLIRDPPDVVARLDQPIHEHIK